MYLVHHLPRLSATAYHIGLVQRQPNRQIAKSPLRQVGFEVHWGEPKPVWTCHAVGELPTATTPLYRSVPNMQRNYPPITRRWQRIFLQARTYLSETGTHEFTGIDIRKAKPIHSRNLNRYLQELKLFDYISDNSATSKSPLLIVQHPFHELKQDVWTCCSVSSSLEHMHHQQWRCVKLFVQPSAIAYWRISGYWCIFVAKKTYGLQQESVGSIFGHMGTL